MKPKELFSRFLVTIGVILRLLVYGGITSFSLAAELAISPTNSIELVEFQAGDFLMGCPNNPPIPWQVKDYDYCRPQHKVELSAFAMSKFPVTESQYCQFLNSSGFKAAYSEDDKIFRNIRNSKVFSPKRADGEYPVSGITPAGAEAYCHWLSQRAKLKCRLPTEAEWEFVARGKQNRTYPWGEKIPPKKTDPVYKRVGVHPQLATPDGVHDMNGPVYQWCMDMYDPRFYFKSPRINPVCTNGVSRVLRGGPSFRSYGEKYVLPPTWKRFQSKETSISTGFRIVVEKTGKEPSPE